MKFIKIAAHRLCTGHLECSIHELGVDEKLLGRLDRLLKQTVKLITSPLKVNQQYHIDKSLLLTQNYNLW